MVLVCRSCAHCIAVPLHSLLPPAPLYCFPVLPQEAAQEYLQEEKLRELVHRYSEFINFPIYMLTTRTEEKEVRGWGALFVSGGGEGSVVLPICMLTTRTEEKEVRERG